MKKLLTFLFLCLAAAGYAQVPTPNAANGITVCVGSTGAFSPSTTVPGYVYTFAVDNGETFVQTFPNQIEITWDTPGSYTLEITTTDPSGTCPPVVSTAVITVQPQGVLNLAPLAECSPNSVTLNGPPGSTYTPTNGGTVVGNTFTAPPGVYIIDVVFIDPNGCASTGQVTVTISAPPVAPTINTNQ